MSRDISGTKRRAGIRRHVSLWGVMLCGAVTLSAAEPDLKLFPFREVHLAVDCELRVYASDEASANAAAKEAYARIAALNAIFSDYDAESEAMKLCRAAGPQPVSPELFFLIDQSLNISRETKGAFDITAAPLIKQWRRARRKKELPTAEQISQAQALTGFQHLRLDSEKKTVEIKHAGLQLDFGGIAKGYIAEEAYRVLARHGLKRSLVSIAGDLFAGDPPPDAPAWRIGIAPLEQPDGPPSRFLALKQQAVSTSGDAFQYVEIDGVRYSHIVDPQSGLGLTQRSSVTVVAPHGWQADGYATAVCLTGMEAGFRLLAKREGVEALAVYRDLQDDLEVRETPGFSRQLWPREDLKR